MPQPQRDAHGRFVKAQPQPRCSACAGGAHDECLAWPPIYPPAGMEPCECTEGACAPDLGELPYEVLIPDRGQGWFALAVVTGVMVLALVVILLGGGW